MSDNKTDSVPAAKSEPTGETEETKSDPKSNGEGESQDKQTVEAPSKIPEKLQGKSTEEIVKIYGDLERKLGEQSASLAEAKKTRENMKIIEKAVFSDPKLTKRVEEAVAKTLGVEPKDSQEEKADGEAKTDTQLSELRRLNENRIFSEVHESLGFNNLGAEEKQKESEKMLQRFADLRDPGGNKPIQQLLSETPLPQLKNLLESSYFLANLDSAKSQGERTMDLASIGVMPASSSKGTGDDDNDVTLTESEKKTADSLGVKHEDYLEQKKSMLSD